MTRSAICGWRAVPCCHCSRSTDAGIYRSQPGCPAFFCCASCVPAPWVGVVGVWVVGGQRRVLALRVGPRGTRSDPAAVPDAEHGPGDAVPGRPAGRPTAGRHEPATRHLRVPTGTGLLRVPQRPVEPSGTFGSLAATQYGNLPLLQIAAITGSYGVSFLIAWFAAAANTVWERSATRAQSRTVAVAFIAVLIAVLAGGGSGLRSFHHRPPRYESLE